MKPTTMILAVGAAAVAVGGALWYQRIQAAKAAAHLAAISIVKTRGQEQALRPTVGIKLAPIAGGAGAGAGAPIDPSNGIKIDGRLPRRSPLITNRTAAGARTKG